MGKRGWCVDERGTEQEMLDKFKKVREGPHRQPCEICGEKVNVDFGFCFVCGRILCDECADKDEKHGTSNVPLKLKEEDDG
jgi:hypothetical protein